MTVYADERTDVTLTKEYFLQRSTWTGLRSTSQSTVHHRRLGPGGHWETVHDDQAPDPEVLSSLVRTVDTATLPPLGVADGMDGIGLRVEQLVGHRDYSSSDGVSYTHRFDRWLVTAVDRDGRSARLAVGTVNELPRAAQEAIGDLARSTGQPPDQWSLNRDTVTIRCDEFLAGVLIHELIGHAAEEADLAEGTAVLPPDVSVSSLPLEGRSIDDDGMPPAVGPLVEEGQLMVLPLARRRGGDPLTPPTGHSWAPSHAADVPARLVNLQTRARRLAAGPAGDFMIPGRLEAARYFRGLAVLEVGPSTYVSPSGDERRGRPLTLMVTAENLRQAVPIASRDEARVSLGFCVKNGDMLPTADRSIALGIENVRFWERS
ncbi:hypothetical protein [Kribbella monticola]|uniref:hypothetical protein n=1 Tax=Kribbella monticola TaxID=2185285 RepID=UPI000DD49E47|nr:hypothetical protein [Kribbella monticola]